LGEGLKGPQDRKEALAELIRLFMEVHAYVDLILVEGQRDVEALRKIGCSVGIEVLSHRGMSDFDLADLVSQRGRRVLVLTDFDEKGRSLNRRFLMILERRGVVVASGLRRRVGRLMARLGVYAVETLDNLVEARR